MPTDPVFSNWDNFNKKVSILNCSRNSNSLRTFIFSSKLKKKVSFSFLVFFTLFQLSVGYVYILNRQLNLNFHTPLKSLEVIMFEMKTILIYYMQNCLFVFDANFAASNWQFISICNCVIGA